MSQTIPAFKYEEEVSVGPVERLFRKLMLTVNELVMNSCRRLVLNQLTLYVVAPDIMVGSAYVRIKSFPFPLHPIALR